ncbi:WecB/TagA/CpsF family glycosyltransferase [Labilithrix luteola]|nr:WecB/TagA/CpsF family glycosyltransferase [Labilithrix luteola]
MMNCRFDALTEAETTTCIFDWAAGTRRSHVIVTVNVAILMMMARDTQLAAACARADLVVADGIPLVWLSRILGTPLPERVTGVDLMARLLDEGNCRGLRIFLLGATEECLMRLVRRVRERYPGVTITGHRHGYFGPSEHADIVRQIRESKSDVLLVGMPAPFKEVWCDRWRDELSTPTILGVGGAFDVLAGVVPRAPKWMQTPGLEWTWRLMLEPRKLWKRYLVTNTQFVCLAALLVVRRVFTKTSRVPGAR